jgi:hypothetical protein
MANRLYLALVALFLSVPSYAAEAALGVRWENAYGKQGRNYNPSAMSAGADGAIFVAGTSAAPGLGGAEPEFWLWKVDASGKLVTETIIARALEAERINPSADHVRDIAIIANGGGAMIIDFKVGDPYFVAFDDAARVTSTKRLQVPEKRIVLIHKLFAQERGGFIGIGTADEKAFALRISAEGDLINTMSFTGVDAFSDATNTGGSIVAIGHSMSKPQQFAVTSFGADLSGQKTVWVKGRRASIASGSDRGQVIVYDASGDDIQDVRIATVKNGLVEDEIALSVSAPSFLPKFEITRLPGERYLVGGTTQDGVAIFVFAEGSVQSRLDSGRNHRPRHWMLDRVLGAPATALTVVYTGGKELTTLVGLMRFGDE